MLRFITKPIVLALLALCVICRIASAYSADLFKQLNAAEIRTRIVNSVISDHAHWSDRFAADGTFHEMSLGISRTAVWKLNGNEVCITRKARKPMYECFEIWASGDEIQYRRDGITLLSGGLQNGSSQTK